MNPLPNSIGVFVPLIWLLLALVLSPRPSLAGDGYTRFAWSRTWHAQNDLLSPLRGYYMPRSPGRCDRENYSDEWNSAAVNAACLHEGGNYFTGGSGYPYQPLVGYGTEPLQRERLGQIPNELDVGGGAVRATGPSR